MSGFRIPDNTGVQFVANWCISGPYFEQYLKNWTTQHKPSQNNKIHSKLGFFFFLKTRLESEFYQKIRIRRTSCRGSEEVEAPSRGCSTWDIRYSVTSRWWWPCSGRKDILWKKIVVHIYRWWIRQKSFVLKKYWESNELYSYSRHSVNGRVR